MVEEQKNTNDNTEKKVYVIGNEKKRYVIGEEKNKTSEKKRYVIGEEKKRYVIGKEKKRYVIGEDVPASKGFWSKLKDKLMQPWSKTSPKEMPPSPQIQPTEKPGIVVVNKEKLSPNNIPAHFTEDFYLARGAQLKSEIEGIDLSAAEIANREDIITLKKLITQGSLNLSDFKRHASSNNPTPVSLAEVSYKMRIAIKNFPKSTLAQSMKNIFSGKINSFDKKNLYGAFSHINDKGQMVDSNGNQILPKSHKNTAENNVIKNIQSKQIEI